MKEAERKELESLVDEIIEVVEIYGDKGKITLSTTGANGFGLSSSDIEGGAVNHPSHYNKGIETIDYIESWNMNFNTGNVIKYVTRAGHKDNKLEDLEKAQWYLQREIQNIKRDIK